MSKSIKSLTSKQSKAGGFFNGQAAFAKISAVEGVTLTQDMRGQFKEFDRQGAVGSRPAQGDQQ